MKGKRMLHSTVALAVPLPYLQQTSILSHAQHRIMQTMLVHMSGLVQHWCSAAPHLSARSANAR